jgi:hypothetical protein
VPDRRGLRFLLEALFLAGLATALAVARLRSGEIVGAMAVGWALVAVLEWSAWRGRPHYGSGLPPRYYVPRLNLPPAAPVQASRTSGFPTGARAAQETVWTAAPAVRTETIGEWPLAVPSAGEPRRGAPGYSDPWLEVSLPVAPLEREAAGGETEVARPVEPVVEPAIDLATWSTVIAARSKEGPRAVHSLDPLAEPPRRRRGAAAEEPARVEVPARPPGVRRPPSRWREKNPG